MDLRVLCGLPINQSIKSINNLVFGGARAIVAIVAAEEVLGNSTKNQLCRCDGDPTMYSSTSKLKVRFELRVKRSGAVLLGPVDEKCRRSKYELQLFLFFIPINPHLSPLFFLPVRYLPTVDRLPSTSPKSQFSNRSVLSPVRRRQVPRRPPLYLVSEYP